MFFLPFSRYRPSTLIWSSPPLLKEMWHCSLRSCLTDKQKWLRCGLISKEKRDRHNPHFTSYIPIHRASTTVCPSVVWHSIIIIRHGRTGKSFPANPIIIFTIIRLQEFFRRIQSDNQMPFSDYSHKDECSSFLVPNLPILLLPLPLLFPVLTTDITIWWILKVSTTDGPQPNPCATPSAFLRRKFSIKRKQYGAFSPTIIVLNIRAVGDILLQLLVPHHPPCGIALRW